MSWLIKQVYSTSCASVVFAAPGNTRVIVSIRVQQETPEYYRHSSHIFNYARSPTSNWLW